MREKGQPDAYEKSLRTLIQSPDARASRRALALLALFYIDQNRGSEALPLLAQAADSYPEVAPWLRLRIAELQQNAGNVSEAVAALQRVVRDSSASSAATIARIRLPGLDPSEAALRDAMSVRIDELSEEEFVALAKALDKQGRSEWAASIRMRLLNDYPQGRFTEETFAAAPVAALSPSEKLALASKLGRYDHYDEALDLLQRVSRSPLKRTAAREYRAVRVHALFNSRHYDQLLQETKRGRLTDPSLVLMRARAAWRSDRPKEFLAGLKRVERMEPRSEQAIEAKILRAKYYTVDEPKLGVAIHNLERAIRAGGSGSEGETLWTLGWTCVLAGRYDEALRVFERYGREFPDGDYRMNALFWSGKIYARFGRTEERDAAFRQLIASYPFNYYSYRAREILGLPTTAPSDIANGKVFPDVDAEIAAMHEPRLDSVHELAWLGLYRDATREMKSIASAAPTNRGVAYRLADLYAEGGEPFRAELVLQRAFRDFVRHGGSNIPHRFWEILYPLKYWEMIRSESARRQVDPYLMASIIRQESGFEPSVVSNAGAVGIMQIMPAEAGRIAADAALPTPTRQQLFDPATNIAVGVAEYSQKLSVMHGNTTLAIAAYNAGEDAVGKWIAQTPTDDMDLFVESIPYGETRLYVKSVTRNRFEYRRIYEGLTSY